jgi:glutamate carboxypeptidase
LGLEPSLEGDKQIHSRNGNRWYKVRLYGEGGHSGREGLGHQNPVHSHCQLYQELLSEYPASPDYYFNVNCIETSSSSFNSLSRYCQGLWDARFTSMRARDLFHKSFEQKIGQLPNQCFWVIEDDCPPMEAETTSAHFYKLLRESVKGLKGLEHSKGAADINYFDHPGVITLDGFGAEGAGFHTPHEYIEKSSITRRCQQIKSVLQLMTNTIHHIDLVESRRRTYVIH